jgi:hypothetical protein
VSVESFLESVQGVSREFFKRVERGNDLFTGKELGRSYFKTETEFEQKGKLVKVSTVLTALHLMAARWNVREYPTYLRGKCEGYVVKGGERIVSKVGALAIGKAVPGVNVVAALLDAAFGFVTDTVEGQNVERAIRDACGIIRREFNDTAGLKQGAVKLRRRRSVSSRHPRKKK